MIHRTANLAPVCRRLLVERFPPEGWSAAAAAAT